MAAAELSEEDAALDAVFGALADPTRRRILARLATAPRSVGEIAAPFAVSLPAVSKHLRVLERAGLIAREVEGRTHVCSLEAATLRAADDWLGPYRSFWAAELGALGRHLGAAGSPRRRGPAPKSRPSSVRGRRPASGRRSAGDAS